LGDNLRIFIVFAFLYLPIATLGASWSALPKGTLSTKFGSATQNLSVYISPNYFEADGFKTLNYEPNNSSGSFVSLSSGSFTLSLASQGASSEESIEKYGGSSGADYQLRIYEMTKTWDLVYQKYSGYHLGNSAELLGSEKIVKVPSLSIEHIGAQMIWNFESNDMNLGASFDQGAIQKETAFSWIGVLSLNQDNVQVNQSLIPVGVTDSVELDKFRRGSFSTVRMGGGGAGAFVRNRFFVSLCVLTTGGVQQQKLSFLGSNFSNDEVSRVINTSGVSQRFGIGYNGDEHYGGITSILETSELIIAKADLNLSTMYFSIYYGMRWDTPGLAFLEIF
jgi:hypothetical protein